MKPTQSGAKTWTESHAYSPPAQVKASTSSADPESASRVPEKSMAANFLLWSVFSCKKSERLLFPITLHLPQRHEEDNTSCCDNTHEEIQAKDPSPAHLSAGLTC
jgi:hypothetical protein